MINPREGIVYELSCDVCYKTFAAPYDSLMHQKEIVNGYIFDGSAIKVDSWYGTCPNCENLVMITMSDQAYFPGVPALG